MNFVKTVKIKASNSRGYKIINESDFDSKKHKLLGSPDDNVDREREAREAAAAAAQKNTSGTYSEPTPTDVRFPDKTQTEFENNLGAQLGKSAAEMREAAGLQDAPGGLKPDPELLPGGKRNDGTLEPKADEPKADTKDAPKAKEPEVKKTGAGSKS